jgi:hypothetical protein
MIYYLVILSHYHVQTIPFDGQYVYAKPTYTILVWYKLIDGFRLGLDWVRHA